MSDRNDAELWAVQRGPDAMLLSLWAVIAFAVWSSFIAGIGVPVSIPVLGKVGYLSVADLLQMGMGVVPSWLLTSLWATGAPIYFSVLGISNLTGSAHAVGLIHFVIIFFVLLFAGHRVNDSSRNPYAAFHLAICHGMVMWCLAVALILGSHGDIRIGLMGFDAAWRYMLVALVAAVSLWLMSGRGLGALVPRQAALGLSSRVSNVSLTTEEIVERNVWHKAVRGQAHIYCQSCGTKLPIWSGGKFCIGCGYPRGIPNGEQFCFDCGAEVGLSDKFCFRCGIDLNRTDSVSQSPVQSLVNSRFCCWCGRELKSSLEAKCSWCGRPLMRSYDRTICSSCHRLGVYSQNPPPQFCVLCGALYTAPLEGPPGS